MILILVAHPDDESLWFGGTLHRLRNAGNEVGIVSVTCKSDPIRSAEFSRACGLIGAKHLMLDFIPDGNLRLEDFSAPMERAFEQARWNRDDIRLVITHSPDGDERHHWQHIDCFHWIWNWARRNRIPLAAFSCSSPESRWATYLPKETVPGGLFYRRSLFSWKTFENTVRIVRSELSKYGWRVAQYRFRQYRQQSFRFNKARWAARIDIDILQKQNLLASYTSQYAGISKYETFGQPFEYLYFFDPAAHEQIASCLRKEK